MPCRRDQQAYHHGHHVKRMGWQIEHVLSLSGLMLAFQICVGSPTASTHRDDTANHDHHQREQQTQSRCPQIGLGRCHHARNGDESHAVLFRHRSAKIHRRTNACSQCTDIGRHHRQESCAPAEFSTPVHNTYGVPSSHQYERVGPMRSGISLNNSPAGVLFPPSTATMPSNKLHNNRH